MKRPPILKSPTAAYSPLSTSIQGLSLWPSHAELDPVCSFEVAVVQGQAESPEHPQKWGSVCTGSGDYRMEELFVYLLTFSPAGGSAKTAQVV